jgi:cell division protein FtsB
MAEWRLNLLAAALLVALLLLQYRLWFRADGMRDIWRLKGAIAQQTAENEKFKKRNDELLFQIQRLQHSADATESRARNELGMVKKGETFYQIVK